MARSLIIEEESGTCRGWVHPHNGYYAGNFWTSDATVSERGSAGPRPSTVVVDLPRPDQTAVAGPTAWPDAA